MALNTMNLMVVQQVPPFCSVNFMILYEGRIFDKISLSSTGTLYSFLDTINRYAYAESSNHLVSNSNKTKTRVTITIEKTMSLNYCVEYR